MNGRGGLIQDKLMNKSDYRKRQKSKVAKGSGRDGPWQIMTRTEREGNRLFISIESTGPSSFKPTVK